MRTQKFGDKEWSLKELDALPTFANLIAASSLGVGCVRLDFYVGVAGADEIARQVVASVFVPDSVASALREILEQFEAGRPATPRKGNDKA